MKLAPTYQKLRGGYYTPKPIADFLAQWAIQSMDTTVLEPSCGDGVLLEAAIEVLLKKGARQTAMAQLVQGIEADPEEAEKAKAHIRALDVPLSTDMVHIGDFFSYCETHLLGQRFLDCLISETKAFDAILGNPPFIRYQNFPEEHRTVAFNLMKQANLHPNRLVNSWLPFLVASTLLLTDRGRLAMVIPAELFQVNYAAETRKFLSDYYDQITLVTFKKLIFDDIQQEVVLLLCERNGGYNRGIRIIEFEDAKALSCFTET